MLLPRAARRFGEQRLCRTILLLQATSQCTVLLRVLCLLDLVLLLPLVLIVVGLLLFQQLMLHLAHSVRTACWTLLTYLVVTLPHTPPLQVHHPLCTLVLVLPLAAVWVHVLLLPLLGHAHCSLPVCMTPLSTSHMAHPASGRTVL